MVRFIIEYLRVEPPPEEGEPDPPPNPEADQALDVAIQDAMNLYGTTVRTTLDNGRHQRELSDLTDAQARTLHDELTNLPVVRNAAVDLSVTITTGQDWDSL